MSIFNSNTLGIEEALKAVDVTSDQMKQNQRECYELFYDKGDEKAREDNCQRLGALIVNKLTKTCFSEYSTHTDNSDVKAILSHVDKKKRRAMQQLLLGGEILIKPLVRKNSFDFMIVKRSCFVPLERDEDGTITCVGTSERTISGATYYTLIEKRTATPSGLVIENKLFSSPDSIYIGREVPLNTLSKYADLEPEITLPISGIGLVQLKCPLPNDVDDSADGVCVYSAATELIRRINLNEQQLTSEFNLGQKRIIVSENMFRRDKYGRQKLVDKVFAALDGDPAEVGIHDYSPTLREASYLARKTEYLRNLESIIGLKRGLLADVQEQDRTATEIEDSKGDYALTIEDIQEVWATAVRDIIALCAELGALYENVNLSGYDMDKDLIIDFGDGVLYNRQQVGQEMLAMVAAGILKPEKYLAWYYNLPCETEAEAQKIRAEYMPKMEQLFSE